MLRSLPHILIPAFLHQFTFQPAHCGSYLLYKLGSQVDLVGSLPQELRMWKTGVTQTLLGPLRLAEVACEMRMSEKSGGILPYMQSLSQSVQN